MTKVFVVFVFHDFNLYQHLKCQDKFHCGHNFVYVSNFGVVVFLVKEYKGNVGRFNWVRM